MRERERERESDSYTSMYEDDEIGINVLWHYKAVGLHLDETNVHGARLTL